jgi:hypothetical protein
VRVEYNQERPHGGLRYRKPKEFATGLRSAPLYSLRCLQPQTQEWKVSYDPVREERRQVAAMNPFKS